MEVSKMEETKKKAAKILENALDFYQEKVANIMDQVDTIINKTSDENILKDLYYVWNELDELKIDLFHCAKLFKHFFGGDQQ
jgi:hypothetical protein